MNTAKTRGKKIKIGLDFDGVVAYNPFRVIRAPVAYVKREIFGIKKLKFFVPEKKWERIFWIIAHESSVFPAYGASTLRTLAHRGDIEFHLITARYSFLNDSLYRWLDRYHLRDVFTSITTNIHDEQPHEYKLAAVKRLGLDYFVEDNFDIVSHLSSKVTTTVYWIYNITDHFTPYPHKVPYLGKALEGIMSEINAQETGSRKQKK